MPVNALKAKVRSRVERHLDRAAIEYIASGPAPAVDFSAPPREPALSSPDSISWRIFKNPVALFIGGVAAVLLELAEPRVRTGIWEHSQFRIDPVGRLKRTGMAAMVTVYGAQSVARRMIARVGKMHDRVDGVTPEGLRYHAADPELLTWVQATANFGFLEAYSAYVAPLSDAEKNRAYAEARPAALLYGATDAPASLAAQRALFRDMTPLLSPSDIIFEFIGMMKRAPALPPPLQLSQHSFVRAAIEITPADVRETLGLDARFGLRPFEGGVIRRMGARADRLVLQSSPPAQACKRLGLPLDYLYRRN